MITLNKIPFSGIHQADPKPGRAERYEQDQTDQKRCNHKSSLLWGVVSLICLLLSTPAWAALIGTTRASHDQESAADPWTFTIDTVTGDKLLVACTTTAAITLTNITHNGDSKTDFTEITHGANTTHGFISWWDSPDVGTGLTVSVDWSASTSADGGCIARTYQGADTSPFTGAEQATSSGDSVQSITVPCGNGGEILAAYGHENNIETPTFASGQTDLFTGDDGAGTYSFTRKDGGGNGIMTYDWTLINGDAVVIGICVNAAASASARSSSISFQ